MESKWNEKWKSVWDKGIFSKIKKEGTSAAKPNDAQHGARVEFKSILFKILYRRGGSKISYIPSACNLHNNTWDSCFRELWHFLRMTHIICILKIHYIKINRVLTHISCITPWHTHLNPPPQKKKRRKKEEEDLLESKTIKMQWN